MVWRLLVLMPGGVSMLAQEFEGPARVRIFSLIGIAFGAGLAFGPTLAGILISLFNWHAVFLSSALISFIALILCIFYMTDSKNPSAHGLDWAGAGTFTLMLTLFTFAVVEAPGAWMDGPACPGTFFGKRSRAGPVCCHRDESLESHA